uniref:Uncharacterized protein n=1 Tax=Setaria digitata TaxID=48799 RepID=A0A915PK86_9BILA
MNYLIPEVIPTTIEAQVFGRSPQKEIIVPPSSSNMEGVSETVCILPEETSCYYDALIARRKMHEIVCLTDNFEVYKEGFTTSEMVCQVSQNGTTDRIPIITRTATYLLPQPPAVSNLQGLFERIKENKDSSAAISSANDDGT